jgi:hypothetical protein
MKQSPVNETTPGELLANFNGRSLKSMIIFTVVAHAVLLIPTSGSYIWNLIAGKDSSKLSESERIELAFQETQSAMRRIAEEHGIKPQDLGSRFAAPAAAPKQEPKAEAKSEPGADTTADPTNTPPPAPEEPKSTIEKELKKAEPGPAVPADEDLFK